MGLNRFYITENNTEYALMASIDECLEDLKTEYIPKDENIEGYIETLSYRTCKNIVRDMIKNNKEYHVLYRLTGAKENQYNSLAIRDYGHKTYCLTFTQIRE